jgi:hypothetical protein
VRRIAAQGDMAALLAPAVTRVVVTSGDRVTAEERALETYAAALAAHRGRPTG